MSRNHLPRRLTIALLAALTALLGTVAAASAHETRQVGDYQLTVGFLNEPAILEEPNGLSLAVQQGQGEEGTPVEGLAGTLQAEVIYGGQTRTLELRPSFGEPGSYQSDFIPTAEGAYTFHISGTINGTEIDEEFTSGPDTFSEVEPRAAMSFPNEVGSVGNVSETAASASDTADTAQMLGLAGLVVGALGLIAGIVGIVMARGTRPAATEETRTASHETGD